MFRRAAALLDFAPADGQQVELRGRLGVYEPRGELQMVVESLQRLGAGTLYEEFLRLPRAAARRRACSTPRASGRCRRFRAAVGVVTSLGRGGAARRADRAARRAPQVRVVVYPSPVQGAEAPAALVAALQRAGDAARGRHAAAGARRRLARGPVGLQRRARGARRGGLPDAGGLRRRPRDRRHAGRPGRRPARAHAHRGGRTGRARARRGAGARWQSRQARAAAALQRACRPQAQRLDTAGAAAGPAGADAAAAGQRLHDLARRLRPGAAPQPRACSAAGARSAWRSACRARAAAQLQQRRAGAWPARS